MADLGGSHPFYDLSDYLAIPRLTSLCLAPDGSWLAATVQALGPEQKKFTTSIWRLDVRPEGAQDASPQTSTARGVPGPSGSGPSGSGVSPGDKAPGGTVSPQASTAPVRLTRSARGESAPHFLPDGSLLFLSARRDPVAARDEDNTEAALWLLPATGGEASRLAAPPGGADELAVSAAARSFLLSAPAFAGTVGADEDAARRKARADAGVTAILHEGNPAIRFWDHDLGPDQLRLLAGVVPDPGGPEGAASLDGLLRDLTPEPGRALDDQAFRLSPDGAIVVTGWSVDDGRGLRYEVVAIDVATASRRTVFAAPDSDFKQPSVSPDGRLIAAIKEEHDALHRPGDVTLVIAELGGATGAVTSDPDGEPRDLLPGFDRRPLTTAWAPDSGSVYFTADDAGRTPVYRVDIQTGAVTKITTDDAAYDHLCPAPDGRFVYALRSSILEPPAPVRIDADSPGAAPARLASPAGRVQVPGHLREVRVTAADGAQVRGWLVLPDSDSGGPSQHSPAPLLLWVHGGPVMTFSAWSWRWNPWLMVARGYAVLLPDPALSTGYGQDFIARGHGTWGDKPYTDVLALTDVVLALPEIDETRTAMMGGSFGGYMANWIAGHTDRFAAIVSHAGIWALDQMFGTTDLPFAWRRAFGYPLAEPERYAASSPHLFADRVVTPVLIIHGGKDFRVPVSEALRMYSDLADRGKNVRFLYFADENHWILKPGDIRVWYETVLAFLAEHVLGDPWRRPELL